MGKKYFLKTEKYSGWLIFMSKDLNTSTKTVLYDIKIKKGSKVRTWRQYLTGTKAEMLDLIKKHIDNLEIFKDDSIRPEGYKSEFEEDFFYDGIKFKILTNFDRQFVNGKAVKKIIGYRISPEGGYMVSFSNLIKENPITGQSKQEVVRKLKVKWDKWKSYIQKQNKVNVSNNQWPFMNKNYTTDKFDDILIKKHKKYFER